MPFFLQPQISLYFDMLPPFAVSDWKATQHILSILYSRTTFCPAHLQEHVTNYNTKPPIFQVYTRFPCLRRAFFAVLCKYTLCNYHAKKPNLPKKRLGKQWTYPLITFIISMNSNMFNSPRHLMRHIIRHLISF